MVEKNTTPLVFLFALSNIWIVIGRLLESIGAGFASNATYSPKEASQDDFLT